MNEQQLLDQELDAIAEEAQQVKTAKYSDDELDRLVHLWKLGRPSKEIAQQLNRAHTSVRNKVKALQKKGVIAPRERANKLPDGFVEHLAGAYKLSVDTVQYFTTLFGGGQGNIVQGTTSSCIAWSAQGGKCFYLGERVPLSLDSSPSGVEPVLNNGEMVLVCRAVAAIRRSVSHDSFVGMCKLIAERF